MSKKCLASDLLTRDKVKEQHYVCGYGSLMSHDSRFRYSGIETQAIPVQIAGWQRSWNMASPGENITCVGAIPQVDAALNALLVAVAEIDEKLRQREENYHFVELTSDAFQVYPNASESQLLCYPEHGIGDARIWICQVANPQSSTMSHPIYQSYVDTCISGCLEHVDEEFAANFIKQTQGWDGIWLNDRKAGRYPRAAQVNVKMQKHIDDLLHTQGVLHHRKEY